MSAPVRHRLPVLDGAAVSGGLATVTTHATGSACIVPGCTEAPRGYREALEGR